MAIQSIVSKKPTEPEATYPRLMISSFGTVVLFASYRCGTVVGIGHNTSEVYVIGSHQEAWSMACFKPLDGKVTLSNL